MDVVDLFSGCGGLSLGLQRSGLNIVGAYENWAPAVAIYRQNFKHPIYNIDLACTGIAIEHIKNLRPELIAGGPPCQDFSSAGKRNENGGRGDLTLAFAQIIAGIKPKWFLMENVERASKSEIFKDAKLILSDSGYGLTQCVIDASLCGVPQKRKRLFLIGRKNEKDGFLNKQILLALSKNNMTLRDYFGNQLGTEHYYRHARSYARRGVFSIDEPSPTIRGVNRPIPPDYKPHNGDSTKDIKEIRPLTTFERSLIQTFPPNFFWQGPNKTTLEQLIGNAVPVNLAAYIGNIIMQYEYKTNNKDGEIYKLKAEQFDPYGSIFQIGLQTEIAPTL